MDVAGLRESFRSLRFMIFLFGLSTNGFLPNLSGKATPLMDTQPSELTPAAQKPRIEYLLKLWSTKDAAQKDEFFFSLERNIAENLFRRLGAVDQALLMQLKPLMEVRLWLHLLEPNDIADVLQVLPPEERRRLLGSLDILTQHEITALLTYAEDDAGGLMNPRFIRLREDAQVDVALRYLRVQAKNPREKIEFAYVLDRDQTLLGIVALRDLLLAPSEKTISEIMKIDVMRAHDTMDQEELSHMFKTHGISELPIVDSQGYMKGVVTLDDIVTAVEEEATEDIQKLGGMEALTDSYLQTNILDMIKKRAGWLSILFVSEMFTASAMGFYEKEIERAVVLAMFIPLIISSGGNSGSQATSLIIRALALNEVRLRDWWRVFLRECAAGLVLGIILGSIGFIRILVWPTRLQIYGEHYLLIAVTIACSLVGIVLWGSLAGSMLPFVLRRLGFDPATSSAPFVSTLVDVTGIVIYFTFASWLLRGTLL